MFVAGYLRGVSIGTRYCSVAYMGDRNRAKDPLPH